MGACCEFYVKFLPSGVPRGSREGAPRRAGGALRSDTKRMYETVLDLSDELRFSDYVAENKKLLDTYMTCALKKFGHQHLVTLKLRYNHAHATYMYHFFGYDGYRDDYFIGTEMLDALSDDVAMDLCFHDSHPDGPGRPRRFIEHVDDLLDFALENCLE